MHPAKSPKTKKGPEHHVGSGPLQLVLKELYRAENYGLQRVDFPE